MILTTNKCSGRKWLAWLVGAFLSLAAMQALAQGAAKVMYAQGETFIERAGVFEPIAVGTSVPEGALLKTGDTGHLYLRLADDGFFVLRPKTTARIALYKPVPTQPEQSQFQLELVNGVARAITGKVAEQAKQRFRFNTPVAAIGVKGTDFVVSTTADVTYIAVNSGAVVASQFTTNCTRAGLGACSSAAASSLSASADLLLAISTGNLGVQTLDLKANPALRQFVPDQTAPPLSNERPLPTSRTNSNALSSTVLALGENPAATADVLKSSLAHSEAIKPVSAQQIHWGRWADVANLGKGVDLANFVQGLEPIGISWPSYVVARNKDSLVMPGAGLANFNLNSFEAGVYLGNNPGSAIAAQITNPTLSVDFGNRTFATQLNMTGGAYKGDFIAKGTVMPSGLFEVDAGRSNMTLAGGLAGNPADQAAYIFSGRIDANAIAGGGTFWRKAP
jgi:hypothetical protein